MKGLDQLPNKPGIYDIRCDVTGLSLLGRSRDIRDRCFSHLRSLRCGSHGNPYLQRTFDKYGEDAFSVSVDTLCPRAELVRVEAERIIARGTYKPGGFNLKKEDGTGSWEYHDDSRSKMSDTRLSKSTAVAAARANGLAAVASGQLASIQDGRGGRKGGLVSGKITGLKNFALGRAESDRRRGWSDEQRAAEHGFPSAEIYREWQNARNEAKRCRKAGDKVGQEAAKERYRTIAKEHTGSRKASHTKWKQKIGAQSPSTARLRSRSVEEKQASYLRKRERRRLTELETIRRSATELVLSDSE